MTQGELGKAVGVSQRAISSYEAGNRRPSPEVAERIAAVLNLSITEMWETLYLRSEKD